MPKNNSKTAVPKEHLLPPGNLDLQYHSTHNYIIPVMTRYNFVCCRANLVTLSFLSPQLYETRWRMHIGDWQHNSASEVFNRPGDEGLIHNFTKAHLLHKARFLLQTWFHWILQGCLKACTPPDDKNTQPSGRLVPKWSPLLRDVSKEESTQCKQGSLSAACPEKGRGVQDRHLETLIESPKQSLIWLQ